MNPDVRMELDSLWEGLRRVDRAVTALRSESRCLHGYWHAGRLERCDLDLHHEGWHRWKRGEDKVIWPKE